MGSFKKNYKPPTLSNEVETYIVRLGCDVDGPSKGWGQDLIAKDLELKVKADSPYEAREKLREVLQRLVNEV